MTCRPTKTPDTAREGQWDFAGACAPSENGIAASATFTLGCFQWVKCARGYRMKRGPVQYRVKGTSDDIAGAYARARNFCATKNAQLGLST